MTWEYGNVWMSSAGDFSGHIPNNWLSVKSDGNGKKLDYNSKDKKFFLKLELVTETIKMFNCLKLIKSSLQCFIYDTFSSDSQVVLF